MHKIYTLDMNVILLHIANHTNATQHDRPALVA